MASRIEHTFLVDTAVGFEIAVPSGEKFTERTDVYYCGVLLTLGTDYTQTETTITFTIRFVAGEDVEVLVDFFDEGRFGEIDILIENTNVIAAVADTTLVAATSVEQVDVAINNDIVTASVSNNVEMLTTATEPDEVVNVSTNDENIVIADRGVQGPPGIVPTPIMIATQVELDALTPVFAESVYITATFGVFTQGFYRFGLTAFERQSA